MRSSSRSRRQVSKPTHRRANRTACETSADRTAALSFDRNSRQASEYGVLAKDTRQLVVGYRTYAAVASG